MSRRHPIIFWLIVVFVVYWLYSRFVASLANASASNTSSLPLGTLIGNWSPTAPSSAVVGMNAPAPAQVFAPGSVLPNGQGVTNAIGYVVVPSGAGFNTFLVKAGGT